MNASLFCARLQTRSYLMGFFFQELIAKVQQLEAHVIQLKNLLAKAKDGGAEKKLRGKQREFDFNK